MSEQVKSPQKILYELLYCYLRYSVRFKVAINRDTCHKTFPGYRMQISGLTASQLNFFAAVAEFVYSAIYETSRTICEA